MGISWRAFLGLCLVLAFPFFFPFPASSRAMSRRLPHSVKPVHYHIDLVPAPSSRPQGGFETFSASVFVTVDVLEATRVFRLNSKGLTIRSASFDGLEGQTRLDAEKDVLEVEFERDIAGGVSGVLKIEYEGPVTTDSTGIYQNSYAGGTKFGIGTQMEPACARKFVPCWDEPTFKATFDLSVVVPDHYTVLFNAPLLEPPSDVMPGFSRHVFGKSPKMSSYLLALFVGEVEALSAKSKSGCEVRVWVPKGEQEVGKTALADGIKCLDFFEEFYGVPYVLPKLDMVGLDSFVDGGMENWGLIVFSPVYLYVRPNALFQSRHRQSYIIAHEIAHMWFGNLVTMEWWNDLWLNEGFATYAGWLAVKHIHQEWDVDAIVFEELKRGLKADGFPSTHAVSIDVSIDDPVLIGNMVDAITYCKGFAVLRMTAAFCGDKAFAEGVRAYVKKFSYKNTKSDDLMECLGKASGKDVATFVGKWLTYVGYPVLHVSRSDNMLTVHQERFLSSGDRTAAFEPWPVEPVVAWGKSGEAKTSFLLDKRSATVELPSAAVGKALNVNPNVEMMMRVVYTPAMWSDLLKHVMDLAPVDRLALLDSRLELGSAGYESTSNFFELVLVLLDFETNPIIFYHIATLLSAFKKIWQNAGAEMRLLIGRLRRRLAERVLALFGAESQSGEDSQILDARSTTLGVLAGDKNHFLHAKFREKLGNIGSLDESSLKIVLRTATFDELERLFEANRASASSSRIILCAVASASDGSVERKSAFLEKLQGTQLFAFFSSLPNSSVQRAILLPKWHWLCEQTSYNSGSLRSMFKPAFENDCDEKLIGELDRFIEESTKDSQSMLTSIQEQLRAAILANKRWIERDGELVLNLLRNRLN